MALKTEIIIKSEQPSNLPDILPWDSKIVELREMLDPLMICRFQRPTPLVIWSRCLAQLFPDWHFSTIIYDAIEAEDMFYHLSTNDSADFFVEYKLLINPRRWKR